ncbi:50S ribosomal protein L3 [Candidatus Woesearchaeota archaeon]|nr:50S ribosomal protein L3 [Candidatus Woesearchaeota archaeon]
MPRARHPRRGSMQFWPRKRSRHTLVRVRSWVAESKVKPLGFIGFKAGMTHLHVLDNRPKSPTKGEKIFVPSTIVECPPMTVAGIAFYVQTSTGLRKVNSVMAEKLDKELGRRIQLPKQKKDKTAPGYDDLRLLVHTNPKQTSTGSKRPKLLEIALGGSKEEKMNFAQGILGKEISIADVFAAGASVDVHGVSKGKGFQGTVKRFGVPIRQHKAEKTKRGIGNLGSWKPKHVQFTVAQSGKMGYHSRTEYNKQILKVGSEVAEINPLGGIGRYGLLHQNYLLLRGSVVGPKKREIVLTPSLRPNPKMTKEAPEIHYISLHS